MRFPTRSIVRFATLASLLLVAAPSSAQPGASEAPLQTSTPAASVQDTPPPLPAPETLPPAAPAPSPAANVGVARAANEPAADRPADDEPTDPRETRRSKGVRMAMDLGVQRAVDGSHDRVNDGSPTILPLGLDLSFRSGRYTLLGVHGYAALGSRDDCISADSCRTRAYGFGGHVEHPLGRSLKFAPWIRYGGGYELVYHGGAPLDDGGHRFRGAIDLLDFRVGGDFIVSRNSETKKSMRVGGYLALVGGVLVNQSGVSHQTQVGGTVQTRSLDSSTAAGHLWVGMGLRATLDP